MTSLVKFIKTLVVHLTAKRALEIHCFKTKEEQVDISLFTVERSSLSLPKGTWPKMQEILRESFSSCPSESLTSADDSDTTATRAIKILEDIIRTPPKRCTPKTRRLFGFFKNIIEGKPFLFPGGMHCETLLATFKYFESSLEGNEDANLKSTCEVFLLHI